MKRQNAKENILPTVLVVEDDEAILSMLQYNLEKSGYNVVFTTNGEEAMWLVEEHHPDVVLLDWMLPGMTGVQICNQLRAKEATKNIPIIMISARGEEGDRIEGLDRGADDYLVKPFSPRELMSRINAVFRRIRPVFSEKRLEYDLLIMDLDAHKVFYNGEDVLLSPIEYKILQSLIENPERAISRDQLLRRIWGGDNNIEARTIDVHINRLRKVFENSNANETLSIRTVRSIGYSLQKHDSKKRVTLVSDQEFDER